MTYPQYKREKMITVYSKNNCPFCDRAKALLESKEIPFTVIKMEEHTGAREFLMEQGLRSVPQIFKDGILIPGGFQGLAGKDEAFFETLKG
jgi:glutaredoxin